MDNMNFETENDLSENIDLEERTSSFKAEICTDIIQTISHVVLARMIARYYSNYQSCRSCKNDC